MKNWIKKIHALGKWTLPAFGSATALWALNTPGIAAADNIVQQGTEELDNPFTLKVQINANSENLYAGHRSHRSHSSHRSHYSGRSGGSYYSPTYSAPSYSAPSYTPSYSAPSTSAPASSVGSSSSNALRSTGEEAKSKKTLPADSDAMRGMIFKVQLALQVKGYYKADLDGELGPQLRDALKRYQRDQKIASTGTITTDTLSALGIPL